MRITFITTKINFERSGGSVPDIDLKVRDMKALGAEVRVITVFSEHNLLPKNLPYPVFEELTPSKTLPAIQRQTLKVLKKYEEDTDVFHIEGQFAYAAGWYRMRGGKPIIAFYNREMLAWERGGFRRTLRGLIEKMLYRTIVPFIDYFIFTTPFLRKKYHDFGLQIQEKKVTNMLDFFDAEAAREKMLPKTQHEHLQIFASGRMVREKGFHLLVEALSFLPKPLRSNLKIIIGGDGPERETLIDLAKKLDVSVQFPGWMSKEDFWKHLASADLFVLPRWQIEQPSVIVMEALALGIPTIAPGGGGVEWMAEDAIKPFRNDDSLSLSETLRLAIENSAERERLTKASHARVHAIDHLANRDHLFSIFKSITK